MHRPIGMIDSSQATSLKAAVAAVCVAFTTLLTGCGEDEGTPTGSTCPSEGSALTYDTFGQDFIATNCLACHSGQEQPTLTSQAAIQQNADLIDRMAASGPSATNTLMPENASVSTEERKKLGEWLACGAP